MYTCIVWPFILSFNPGLALTGARKNRPQLFCMSPRSNRKACTWSAQNFKTLNPRYGHMMLVNGYLVSAGVNWS